VSRLSSLPKRLDTDSVRFLAHRPTNHNTSYLDHSQRYRCGGGRAIRSQSTLGRISSLPQCRLAVRRLPTRLDMRGQERHDGPKFAHRRF
jgi:hypothetical protein